LEPHPARSPLGCIVKSDTGRDPIIHTCDMLSVYFNLQPTGARRAFPCWDEPTIRATFDITLIVPKDRVALSNMVIKFKCTDQK